MPIPLSADHIAQTQGSFTPQTGNTWTLEIADFPGDQNLIYFSLGTLALPPESNEVMTIPWGNEFRKYAGKATFEAIPLTIKDWVDQPTRKAVMDWRAQVYDQSTGAVGLPSVYKKTGEIILAASDGSLERTVRMHGLWPSALNPGALDMANAEQVMIELTLELDRAEWLL